MSTTFRILIAALHFTVFFVLLATPLMGFGKLLLANILYFYCELKTAFTIYAVESWLSANLGVYGMASCVSMIVKREDGPLLAVVVSLISGTLCGYGPSLLRIKQWHLEWLWRMCPGVCYSST